MVVPGARAAIESLYTDVCTILAQQDIQPEPDAKPSAVKRTEAVVLVSDQPCRLSYESLSAAGGDPAAVVAQSVKLFMSPDVAVPAGSDIAVTHKGMTLDFNSSGLPAVYATHQEIPLEPKGRYA